MSLRSSMTGAVSCTPSHDSLEGATEWAPGALHLRDIDACHGVVSAHLPESGKLSIDAYCENSERQYTGVRKNKGGRFSARIKINGTNQYIGTYSTAQEAARAFDERAVQCGRPVETLNFPQDHGGPTKGRAYRKRKQNKLYTDSSHHINMLLQKLADVDRSNPSILRLTMVTLGVPESRLQQTDHKFSGVRKQSSHWEARIRFKDKLYSMGFYCSPEAAALAWDITASSLQRISKLNFPEVGLSELEQQLDALKSVIIQTELQPSEEARCGGSPTPQPAGHSTSSKLPTIVTPCCAANDDDVKYVAPEGSDGDQGELVSCDAFGADSDHFLVPQLP